MQTLDLLKKLTSAVGISGCEDNVSSLLCDILKQYGETKIDDMNNVICTFGEGRHFLLEAHLDEIGFIVTGISEDGFIKFDKIGGIDTRALPAAEVTVFGTKAIDGVISTLPPHLQCADDENNAPKLKNLSVDTGYTAAALNEIVSPGDRITFRRNFTPLLNGFVSASCLDDRSGVCAILLALDELKKLPCKITVLFSSQEEVGKRGAVVGAYSQNADEAICVDVSFAYTPTCDREDCGEISKGAMIGFSPILDSTMSRALVETAKKNNIAYQCEVMNSITGTDADEISVSKSGVKSALLSIPEKYMHQCVEVVDVKDIESVSALICAYIREKAGEQNA